MRGGGELDQRAWCLNSLPHIASKLTYQIRISLYFSSTLLPKGESSDGHINVYRNEKHFCQHHAPVFNALQFLYDIYASKIKSPSAVQISKSIKQTQSVDKI